MPLYHICITISKWPKQNFGLANSTSTSNSTSHDIGITQGWWMILKIWSSSHWLSCSWSPMSLLITHDLFLMPSINDSRDLVHWDNQREEDIIVIMRQYWMTIAKASSSSSLFCRDLALAGEFGRELLQTNDELRTAIERHRQESARRIEVQTIFGLVWFEFCPLVYYWFIGFGYLKMIHHWCFKNRDLNKRDTRFVDNWRTLKTLGRWSGSWFFRHKRPWETLRDLEDSWQVIVEDNDIFLRDINR